MNTGSVEKLTWALIYGGLLSVCLGLFVKLQDVIMGWRLVFGGVVAAALGAVLIWVRSRRDS